MPILEPDEQGVDSALSITGEFVKGAINEALLGFPQWLIDRDKEGLFKEGDTKAERIARGVGSFIGFFGLPGAVALKGAKIGSKVALKGALKAGVKSHAKMKLAKAVGSGAGSFAAFSAAQAPSKDETLQDRLAEIPMSAIMGGTLGIAGHKLSPIIKKYSKQLNENLTKTKDNKELNSILTKISDGTKKLVDKADNKFKGYLDSNQYDKANQFMHNFYQGARLNTAQTLYNTSKLNFVKSNPKLSKMFNKRDLASKVIALRKAEKPTNNIAKDLLTGIKTAADKMAYNKITTSTDTLLRHDSKAGAQVANIMNLQRSDTERVFAFKIDNIFSKLKELTKNQKKRIEGVLQGRLENSPDIAPAVNLIAKEFDVIKRYAMRLGVKVKDKNIVKDFIGKDRYFPRMIVGANADKAVVDEMIKAAVKRYPKSAKMTEPKMRGLWNKYNVYMKGEGKKRAHRDLVNHIARQNKMTPAQAESHLIAFQKRMQNPKFGNLEYSRTLDLDFWDPNIERVLPKYIGGAYNRLFEYQHLGKGNEKLLALREHMKDTTIVDDLITRISGSELNRPAMGVISRKASENLRKYQVVTKLGTSAIPNASQSINTAMVTGTKNTANAIKAALSKGTREEQYKYALKSSAILESTLNDYLTNTGIVGGFAQKFLRRTGFIAVEKFNRTVAANAGKEYILANARALSKNPADKAARRALQELGYNIKPILKRNGNLTWKELVRGTQKIVNKTQFRAGPLDLPLFFTSAEGKIFTQFKSFAFNQTKLMKDLFLSEVSRGNLKPLATALIAAPIVGEGVKDARAIVTGRIRDERGLERLIDNASAVGGLGMVNDLFQAAKYNNVKGWMAGPTFSDLGQVTKGVVKASKGRPKTLQSYMLKNIPVAGPLIKNTIAPSPIQVGKRNKAAKRKLEKKLGRKLTKKEFNKLKKDLREKRKR